MSFQMGDRNYDGAIMAGRAVRPQDYPDDKRKVWNDLIAQGVQVPPTYPGSVHEPCLACDIAVQVGPRQQAQRDQVLAGGGSVVVMCLICAAAAVRADMSVGSNAINPEPYNLGNPFKENP